MSFGHALVAVDAGLTNSVEMVVPAALMLVALSSALWAHRQCSPSHCLQPGAFALYGKFVKPAAMKFRHFSVESATMVGVPSVNTRMTFLVVGSVFP